MAGSKRLDAASRFALTPARSIFYKGATIKVSVIARKGLFNTL
jgi:hypothetical protein